MKILITENQLDKVIDNFITREVGEIYLSHKAMPMQWFSKKNHQIKLHYISQSETLWIKDQLWNDVKKIFNLTNIAVVNHYKKWAHKHLQIDPNKVRQMPRSL